MEQKLRTHPYTTCALGSGVMGEESQGRSGGFFFFFPLHTEDLDGSAGDSDDRTYVLKYGDPDVSIPRY